jgi:hypothetical protein
MNVFGLSFLDCICCGFGAVILLFVIVNSRTDEPPPPEPPPPKAILAPVTEPKPAVDRTAEIASLRLALQRSKAQIRAMQKAMEDMEGQQLATADRAKRLREEASQLRQQSSDNDERETAVRDRIKGLQGDLLTLEQEVEQLRAALAAAQQPEPPQADDALEFAGEGDRLYLTGLKVGGSRILILFDCSSSMLHERIVEIIRLRNMQPEKAKQAEKWQQGVHSVEWLLSQLPQESQFQIHGFNERVFPMISGTDGQWLDVSDGARLDAAVTAIKAQMPTGGTSLERALESARDLAPMPDNVILVTDGLPTMANLKGLRRTITPKKRLSLFRQATKNWPKEIPVNVILLPMEGDPDAANAFWTLAVATRGSFFCPAEDWP